MGKGSRNKKRQLSEELDQQPYKSLKAECGTVKQEKYPTNNEPSLADIGEPAAITPFSDEEEKVDAKPIKGSKVSDVRIKSCKTQSTDIVERRYHNTENF